MPESVAPKQRVICYVDGFNLYHGLKEHAKTSTCIWLNLWSLMQAQLLPEHELIGVKYFTSLTPWNYKKSERHKIYIAALEHFGVEVVMGRFQRDPVRCEAECKQEFTKGTEKLTDVKISTSVLVDCVKNKMDWVYMVTGDADQAPTLHALRELSSTIKARVIYSPCRGTAANELERLSDVHAQELQPIDIQTHQMPEYFRNASGRHIRIPHEWKLAAENSASKIEKPTTEQIEKLQSAWRRAL